MGLVKGYFHEEICAAQDDQRADEFDCYEARLHSLLSELDWFRQNHDEISYPTSNVLADLLQIEIKDLMK